ncbi:MAG: hypothetical protein AB1779_10965 [Candidatus Thermoplasmatota archaeon]
MSEKELNNVPTSAHELRKGLEKVLKDIRTGGRNHGDEFEKISKKICEYSEGHMEELFASVKDRVGNEIKIVRHNGIEELNHRWCRMHIRRRTGRNQTTKEMTKYGALLAVLSNLKNESYVKTV